MKLFEFDKQLIGKVMPAAKKYFKQTGDPKTFFQQNDIKQPLESKLAKLGWTKLNGGNYSSVYQNPKKNFIMKINDIPDRGFADFVDIIKKHRNPHFPIVYDAKYATFFGLRYYVYLIEKLEPMDKRTATRLSITFSSIISNPRNAGYYRNIPLFKQNPDLFGALMTLAKYRDVNSTLDLHDENIMKRKDGTIVIIDPFFQDTF